MGRAHAVGKVGFVGALVAGLLTVAPRCALADGEDVGLFVNPGAMVFGEYGLEFDVRLARRLSLNLSASYYDVKGSDGTSFSLGPQFFLTGSKTFSGLYLFPRAFFVDAHDPDYFSTHTYALGGLATVGYQWVWAPLALRAGGGGGAVAGVGMNPDPVFLAVDLALGLVF